MKTPEEIAAETIGALDFGEGIEADEHALSDAFKSGWFDGGDVAFMIQRAIEADRAQRTSDPQVELQEWAIRAANALALDHECELSQSLVAEWQVIQGAKKGDS